MHAARPGLLLLLVVGSACGGVTRTEPAGDSASAGSSTGGTGGAPVASSSGSSSSSNGEGGGSIVGAGGGTVVNCPTIPEEDLYWINLQIDAHPTVNIHEACENEPVSVPVAQVFGGGECSPGVSIRGCWDVATQSYPAIFIVYADLTGPGSGPAGGEAAGSMFFTAGLTIDAPLGAVGQAVKGSYTAEAIGPDGQTQKISGDFNVCRIPDDPPCP